MTDLQLEITKAMNDLIHFRDALQKQLKEEENLSHEERIRLHLAVWKGEK